MQSVGKLHITEATGCLFSRILDDRGGRCDGAFVWVNLINFMWFMS